MTTLVILKIVAFVLPLGLDTLAIAIALGLRGLSPWRPAFTFAIFEGIMPIFGIILARIISLRFEAAAVVIGGMMLIGIGFNTIREAMLGEEGAESVSFSSFRASLVAGLAISTDELAIGFPLGASGLPIATALIAIAVQALFVTALGIAVGNRVGSALGRRASRYAGVAAGIAFSAVGLWLILEAVLAR
jgi:putative Mn2+ efflux pump MntP